MKCPLTGQECFKSKVYHITDIEKDGVKSIDCCSECFVDMLKSKKKEELPPPKTPLEFLKTMVEFVDFLSGKLPEPPEGAADLPPQLPPAVGEPDLEKIKTKLPHCPGCDFTLLDVQKTGRLGCPQCYVTFEKQLSKTLNHYHANNPIHVGKTPKKHRPKKKSIEDRIRALKASMQGCIAQERYEDAAKIRDDLKLLEEKERRKRKLKHQLDRHLKQEDIDRAKEISKQMEDIDQED